MSVEEDIELKNLVAQTLENKGILPKIRAELRANVFLALEENPNTRDTLLKNDALSSFIKIPIGALVLNLIREFLEFFDLDFTLSVFDPETKYGKEYNGVPRDKILKELKMPEDNKSNPLLVEVISRMLNNNNTSDATNKQCSTQQRELSDNLQGGDVHNITASPLPLNTTYVKKSENDSIQLSPVDKDSREDTNESIQEEVMSNNFSESESLSEVQLDLNRLAKTGVEKESNSKDTCTDSKVLPKETIEIDLLTFTPVKEKEKIKNIGPCSEAEKKTEDKTEKPKSSVLGDLPPLNAQSEEKDFDMNDIKAIIDEWSDKNNLKNKGISDSCKTQQGVPSGLKLDYSDNSQSLSPKSDDFEEDTSELLNGCTPLDTPKTVDETISKVSCAGDYLESV
ncbi:hypothetical protein RUM44_004460 [Polyplax serrata]|uniref:FGFR1 oncogene partner (FOP) N-terminal dimerisation domain-containing protein n=1 Tax=Polyplax serrata TaxID=468196 RepID=A0ABR1B3B8_POLSC